MITNVTHIGGTQEGIAYSMYQHVGITVTQQSQLMLYLYSTHPQVATFHQLMNIKPKTNSNLHYSIFNLQSSTFNFHRLNKSLIPSISNVKENLSVWSSGVLCAVEMT